MIKEYSIKSTVHPDVYFIVDIWNNNAYVMHDSDQLDFNDSKFKSVKKDLQLEFNIIKQQLISISDPIKFVSKLLSENDFEFDLENNKFTFEYNESNITITVPEDNNIHNLDLVVHNIEWDKFEFLEQYCDNINTFLVFNLSLTISANDIKGFILSLK